MPNTFFKADQAIAEEIAKCKALDKALVPTETGKARRENATLRELCEDLLMLLPEHDAAEYLPVFRSLGLSTDGLDEGKHNGLVSMRGTCRNVHAVGGFECSECGASVSASTTAHEGLDRACGFAWCPHCGRAVDDD